MSTIKVTTIQDTAGGNSSTSAEIYSGRAKAWVNFNGQGATATRADYNVNTIGDNGTGNYTVNFTNALEDANYSVVSGGPSILASDNQTANNYRIRGYASNFTVQDKAEVFCAIFR